MHPFMLHAASPNHRRVPRIITNPAVALAEPFCYARSDPSTYSLVELKTILDLGGKVQDGGVSFKILQERRRIVPERQLRQERQKLEELERLAAAGQGTTYEV